eukprot:353272-Chlamydomonas_euryale.AAC.6
MPRHAAPHLLPPGRLLGRQAARQRHIPLQVIWVPAGRRLGRRQLCKGAVDPEGWLHLRGHVCRGADARAGHTLLHAAAADAAGRVPEGRHVGGAGADGCHARGPRGAVMLLRHAECGPLRGGHWARLRCPGSMALLLAGRRAGVAQVRAP